MGSMERPRLSASFAVLLPLTAALLSCDFLPTTVTVRVTAPETPAVWEAVWGPARFAVSWRSAAGGHTSSAVIPAGGQTYITVPRLLPVAVRAEAVWPEDRGPALAAGERLATAGGVWPFDVEDARSPCQDQILHLGFDSGPAAEVTWRLLEAGVDIRRFSVDRLSAEIADRLPDDPWELDIGRVVTAVAGGAMRVTYVRPVAARDVSLAVPEGRWYRFSPFADPVTDTGGMLTLPVGVTVLYGSTDRRLVVDVDERGRAWFAQTPR